LQPDSQGAAGAPNPWAATLIDWQARHGRHGLPWQGTRDPYRVWLSEVMLQQTQVSTVLTYFDRFLTRFPAVAHLAAAPLDDVLALWSGLGYYSRARNLHRCAQAVMEQHGGRFPANASQLTTLPGIGRSTAAAIAAFCFDQRVAILDGNVKRVLSRVLAFEGDLAASAQEKLLWARAEALLPPDRLPAYTQALMDLGATVCLPRAPLCQGCPLQDFCRARALDRVADFPRKSRKLRRSLRSNALLWLRQGSRSWLVQRPPVGVWAGLYSLPEFGSKSELQALSSGWPGHGHWLPAFKHVLTHFDWQLQVLVWHWPLHQAEPEAAWLDGAALAVAPKVEEETRPALAHQTQAAAQWALQAPGGWHDADQALALGLPAPVRKLFLKHLGPGSTAA